MKCLLTGGAGSLGTAVASRLLAGGHDVVVVDLVPSSLVSPGSGRFESVCGDVNDEGALLQTVRRFEVDTIFHLASLLAVESDLDPVAAVRVNSGGMASLLAVAKAASVRRFVWASSNGVFARYDSGAALPDDSSAYYPNNIYAGTKVLNELLARHYVDEYGMSVVGLRLTLMLGTGKARGRSGEIGRQLIENPLRGLPGRIRFGDDVPSWLWLDDGARALVLAAETAAVEPRTYNVGGDPRSVREAVSIIEGLIPGARITVEPGHYVRPHGVDTSAFEAMTGFRSSWSLEDQLAELVRRAAAELHPEESRLKGGPRDVSRTSEGAHGPQ